MITIILTRVTNPTIPALENLGPTQVIKNPRINKAIDPHNKRQNASQIRMNRELKEQVVYKSTFNCIYLRVSVIISSYDSH